MLFIVPILDYYSNAQIKRCTDVMPYESGIKIFYLFQELKKHDVNDVVRVCEPTYKTDELRSGGITVTDLVFDDGTFPPNEVG
ncbi:hypothetical protein Avbf_07112 [Armadillidium vulgare]|nr:hypothetical protein Avbf_07112 [Armadillidium vulgare]